MTSIPSCWRFGFESSRTNAKSFKYLEFAPTGEGPYIISKAYDGGYYLISRPNSEVKFGSWEPNYDVVDPLYSVIIK